MQEMVYSPSFLFVLAITTITYLEVPTLESDRPGFKSQYFQLMTFGKSHVISKTQVTQLKNEIIIVLTSELL